MRLLRSRQGALVALIVVGLSACDNVDWGGVDVAVVPPPPRGAGGQAEDAERELGPLPTGPVLYYVRTDSTGGTIVPVAEIGGDTLIPLGPGADPELYGARFISEHLRRGRGVHAVPARRARGHARRPVGAGAGFGRVPSSAARPRLARDRTHGLDDGGGGVPRPREVGGAGRPAREHPAARDGRHDARGADPGGARAARARRAAAGQLGRGDGTAPALPGIELGRRRVSRAPSSWTISSRSATTTWATRSS